MKKLMDENRAQIDGVPLKTYMGRAKIRPTFFDKPNEPVVLSPDEIEQQVVEKKEERLQRLKSLDKLLTFGLGHLLRAPVSFIKVRIPISQHVDSPCTHHKIAKP